MSDLINKAELLAKFRKKAIDEEYKRYEIESIINSMPTVEQKHGHWVIHNKWHNRKKYVVCECSNCHKTSGGNYKATPYCSMCGAKMEEVFEDV